VAEYVVREVSPMRWEVAKFGDKSEPLEVYRVEKIRTQWRCSCPVTVDCKHIDRVRVWIYIEDRHLPEYLGGGTVEEMLASLEERIHGR